MMKITTGLIVSGILSLATSLGRAQSTDSLDFSFAISLTDYLGASGQLYEYDIFRDSLRISYDCDFVSCQRKVIYRRMIGGVFGERFSQFLSELRIDTLRSRYSAPSFDGLVRAVVTQRNSEDRKSTRLNSSHLVIS